MQQSGCAEGSGWSPFPVRRIMLSWSKHFGRLFFSVQGQVHRSLRTWTEGRFFGKLQRFVNKTAYNTSLFTFLVTSWGIPDVLVWTFPPRLGAGNYIAQFCPFSVNLLGSTGHFLVRCVRQNSHLKDHYSSFWSRLLYVLRQYLYHSLFVSVLSFALWKVTYFSQYPQNYSTEEYLLYSTFSHMMTTPPTNMFWLVIVAAMELAASSSAKKRSYVCSNHISCYGKLTVEGVW